MMKSPAQLVPAHIPTFPHWIFCQRDNPFWPMCHPYCNKGRRYWRLDAAFLWILLDHIFPFEIIGQKWNAKGGGGKEANWPFLWPKGENNRDNWPMNWIGMGEGGWMMTLIWIGKKMGADRWEHKNNGRKRCAGIVAKGSAWRKIGRRWFFLTIAHPVLFLLPPGANLGCPIPFGQSTHSSEAGGDGPFIHHPTIPPPIHNICKRRKCSSQKGLGNVGGWVGYGRGQILNGLSGFVWSRRKGQNEGKMNEWPIRKGLLCDNSIHYHKKGKTF